MNTEFKKQAKNNWETTFFKPMNNAILRKTAQNVRKYRDTELVTTDKRRKQLVSYNKMVFRKPISN